eukprot:SAG11_NODE_1637_length_4536_cov_14.839982_2_plen_646_part_00
MVCLAPGERVLNYRDSFGDGWHGGSIEVVGFVDPIAVAGYGSTTSFNFDPPSEATWEFRMLESGWNGNTATIYNCDGLVLQQGIVMSGSDNDNSWGGEAADVCLADSNGYIIAVDGPETGAAWELLEPDGTLHYAGGAPEVYSSCPGTIIDLAYTTSPYEGSTTNGGDAVDLSCGGQGREQGFQYLLQPGLTIDIGQSENNYESRHELRVGGDYPGNQTVVCVDDADTTNQISYTNNSPEPIMVYFIVGAQNNGVGDFTLTWTVQCTGNDWDFVMSDSGGNGWGGGTATIYDCDMVPLQGPLTLDSDAAGTASVCLDSGPVCTDVTVNVVTTSYGNEVTWSLDDGDVFGPYGNDATDSQVFCLEPGEHELNYVDSWGDGWHGGTIEVVGLVAPIEVAGAGSTTPFVIADAGYIVQVVGGTRWDQVGWELQESNVTVHLSGSVGNSYSTCPPPPPSECVQNGGDDWEVIVMDSSNNGWNGNTLTIYDCSMAQLVEIGLESGSGSSTDVCLAASDGYIINVGGGGYNGWEGSQASWKLLTANGTVYTEGGTGYYNTCPPPPPPVCPGGNDWDFVMIDSAGDGWGAGNEAMIYDCNMTVVAGPLTLLGGAEDTADVCLAASKLHARDSLPSYRFGNAFPYGRFTGQVC